MIEIGFRASLDDFLMDVDIFSYGEESVMNSGCFWELLAVREFRELTVKAVNYELDRISGHTTFDEGSDDPDPSEVDENFQFNMFGLKNDLYNITSASEYEDLSLEIMDFEEFTYTLTGFLTSYIEELESDISIRIKSLSIRNDLITVVID